MVSERYILSQFTRLVITYISLLLAELSGSIAYFGKVLAPVSISERAIFYFSPLQNEFCNSALSILLIDQFPFI